MTAQAAAVQAGANGKTAWPYRFEIVRVENVYADRFQRPLNQRWLKSKEENFDPAMLGTATLSERQRRGKGYSVVDGQHRVELCRRVGLEVIPAVVFYDLGIEDEARLFSRFQRERRAITPYQRFQADLIAGDPQAKSIARIVRDEGLELSESMDSPGHIKCVVALETIYKDDPASLRLFLQLVQATWPDLPYGRSERLLKGIWHFNKKVGDVDFDRFVDRLGRVTPSTLVTRAQQLREARGRAGALPMYMAEAVENEYRRRGR